MLPPPRRRRRGNVGGLTLATRPVSPFEPSLFMRHEEFRTTAANFSLQLVEGGEGPDFNM